MGAHPWKKIRMKSFALIIFRVIADYILNHSDEVLKTNIHKLGRDLDIAESSIVRFCKVL